MRLGQEIPAGFESVMAALISKDFPSALCPMTVNIACSDFMNYLKVKWNTTSEEVFGRRFSECLGTEEFRIFVKCWFSEWSHQWKQRTKIVSKPDDIPKHKPDQTPVKLSEEAYNDLGVAAIMAMINNKLLCGTEKLAEAVISQASSDLKQKKEKMAEKQWNLMLLQQVCRDARNLAKTHGPLIWVLLPKPPKEELRRP